MQRTLGFRIKYVKQGLKYDKATARKYWKATFSVLYKGCGSDWRVDRVFLGVWGALAVPQNKFTKTVMTIQVRDAADSLWHVADSKEYGPCLAAELVTYDHASGQQSALIPANMQWDPSFRWF